MKKTMGTNTLARWQMRRGTLDDLDALVCLEEACFSDPWSRKSFEAELAGNQFSRLFVVLHPDGGLRGGVVGSFSYRMHQQRPADHSSRFQTKPSELDFRVRGLPCRSRRLL